VSAISDDVLLPLRERLQDWQDFDAAGFFLGKALGVIPPEQTWGRSKDLIWYQEEGLKLIETLRFLVNQGFLEIRDDCEYRWRTVSLEEPLRPEA